MFSCAGSDTIISDRCFYIIITYYLYVPFVSAVFVDGHFRRHIDLILSCYIIVYLQTAGVKYCYKFKINQCNSLIYLSLGILLQLSLLF